jgi:RHS repeat-associated protein
MRKTILFIVFLTLILRGVSFAQNPYQSIGKEMPKGKMLTLSNGKYQEFFPNDTLTPIGSVRFNTITGEVEAFLTRDTMYAEYNLEPELVSRWLSPDPLGAKYTQWSPYNYTLNNPVRFIDPDGREVVAPSQASKDLVLKTVTFMFGKNHGYSFNGDNKLVHGGTAPSGMSAGQTAMYGIFNGALVDSKTKTTVKANESIASSQGGQLLNVKSTAAATTFYESASTMIAGNEKTGTVKVGVPANQTILMPENTVNNGTNAQFTDGTKPIGADHALTHEFGHSIVNVIMNEMGGVFNGTDFNKMTEQERSDWSIRFTNTLMKSQNNTQENGEGQHGQTANQRPKNSLRPINE